MEGAELLTILAWVLLWAVVIGAATLVLLRYLRRASMLVQICLVVLATVAVLVAGMVSAFNAMFISARDLEVMWYILAVASAVALGIALVLGAGVSRNAARLAAAARQLGAGDAHPAGETGSRPLPAMTSELARLARELEQSSVRLEESRRREAAVEHARRELVSWISHDLRTPLAGMRAMAEALEDGMAPDPSAYHRKIISHSEQMAAMVNDLLELSKIQAGTLRMQAEALDLYDLLSDAIADLAPLAARRGITLDGGAVGHCLAVADGPSLGRAVRNMLHNAVIYSRPDSTVRIGTGQDGTGQDGAGPDGAGVLVSVQDSCGGIAEEDLPHLFETGWQKDAARRRDDDGGGSLFSGAGVGLSMVAGIVKAHGGSVSVANSDDGCRFELRLPAAGTAKETPGRETP
ncbi:HAMP domain-containing sensor histidine kinase [Arthrobacter sp. SW1]|uniref:sensor histidine kinase n=1 Tax=Arthrobacter sp. SW1 TaxID=1920889 RepID=UPI0009F47D48|nr:HAMP domain-containing sensor histidine kinase [Arthrobacter sp. SW1]